jgi:hypothetical protein
MDIRVGKTPPVGAAPEKQAGTGNAVEAKVLAVRAPRKRSGGAPPEGTERREGQPGRDPHNGRVLLLLIPDGSVLPAGLERGDYRVFLRFTRR